MKTSSNSSPALKNLQLRFLSYYALLQTFSYFTYYNFIAGFIFLLLRQLRLVSIDFIGFAVVGFPVCVLAATAMAMRRKLAEEQALALLDSHNKSGGMLLAEFETGDKTWQKRQGDLQAPRLKLNLRRRLPALLVSLLFIVLSVTIPVRQVAGDRDPRLDLKDLQQKAIAQVEAMEEAGLVDEEKALELKNTIEQLAETSDRNDPSKTFEAFDQLQEKMRKESASGAEKMLSEQENLQSLQTLADNLQNAQNSEQLSKALDTLRDKLEKLGMDAASMRQPGGTSLEDKMQQAGKGSEKAADEAAQQLQDYIKQRAEDMRAAAEQLVKARLLDRKTYEKLKKEGRLRPATPKDMQPDSGADLVIAPSDGDGSGEGQTGEQTPAEQGGGSSGQSSGSGQNDSKSGSGNGNGQSGDDKPGLLVIEPNTGTASGRPGQDGGTAPLNFSRQSSEHNLKFRDEALPSPATGDLKDSVAIGMAISAPEVNAIAKNGVSGPVDWQKSEKSGGESDVILPRHRSAVKRYFERKVLKRRKQQ